MLAGAGLSQYDLLCSESMEWVILWKVSMIRNYDIGETGDAHIEWTSNFCKLILSRLHIEVIPIQNYYFKSVENVQVRFQIQIMRDNMCKFALHHSSRDHSVSDIITKTDLRHMFLPLDMSNWLLSQVCETVPYIAIIKVLKLTASIWLYEHMTLVCCNRMHNTYGYALGAVGYFVNIFFIKSLAAYSLAAGALWNLLHQHYFVYFTSCRTSISSAILLFPPGYLCHFFSHRKSLDAGEWPISSLWMSTLL